MALFQQMQWRSAVIWPMWALGLLRFPKAIRPASIAARPAGRAGQCDGRR